MKANTFISILFLFVFFSCKKEKKVESPPSTTALVDGSSSYATSYYGILALKKSDVLDPNDVLQSNGILRPNAMFSSVPVGIMGTANSVQVDSIKLNAIRLRYDGFYSYEDSTYTQFSNPFNWEIVGKNGISSFTYTNNSSFPLLSGYVLLPDTVTNSAVLNFNLSGVSNTDLIVVMLSDNNGFTYKELSANSSNVNVSFTNAEMLHLTSGNSGSLLVWLIKNNVRNFGGKPFNFTTEYLIRNNIYIK